MASGGEQQRVALAPEDLARVRRLTEEVKGRLFEVGLIMGRTLGHTVGPATPIKYEARQDTDADQTIEVVIIMLPDGTFCCTQDPPGICQCPC